MTNSFTLKASPRSGTGSRAAAKLRKLGLVPGIVYGHQQQNVAVAVPAADLDRAVRLLHLRMLQLDVGGQVETVLIREIQWDPFGRSMIHVDFERKSTTENVKVVVPVELRNVPKASGGAVLDQPFHALHIECPLGQIPEAIRIDITNLTVGHPIHVKDLVLPESVRVLESPDAVVVQLKLVGAEPPAGAAAATGTAEPEVIKKEKKAEDANEK